jgi:hypothetical protein
MLHINFIMKHTFIFLSILALSILSFKNLSASNKAIEPGNLVIQWNLLTLKVAKKANQNSNLASRTAAIEAIAVYDAVNSIKHFGTPYHYFVAPTGAASAQAAVVQAAHDVLVN